MHCICRRYLHWSWFWPSWPQFPLKSMPLWLSKGMIHRIIASCILDIGRTTLTVALYQPVTMSVIVTKLSAAVIYAATAVIAQQATTALHQGIGWKSTTRNRAVTLENVKCINSCVTTAPIQKRTILVFIPSEKIVKTVITTCRLYERFIVRLLNLVTKWLC